MSSSLWTDLIASLFAFTVYKPKYVLVLCGKYFCTSIGAHPCFSPFNWTNRLSCGVGPNGSSQEYLLILWNAFVCWSVAWQLKLTLGCFNELHVYLVLDCPGTLWIQTLMYDLCLSQKAKNYIKCGDIHLSNKEARGMIYQWWALWIFIN